MCPYAAGCKGRRTISCPCIGTGIDLIRIIRYIILIMIMIVN